ncbi:D-3-phosphoglycerate dehydrogenase [Desulfurella amilsii]|uniref:D-3-phosphoglycerate dehydrogenase n=1 Tax=Desulfurella amilsii TaxID=1562698 RepID=A0A1X4XY21_9BACT|nr:D-glycerate dehydrogenase [Desulfurella amilsii]OSS42440.1 D-3-phosphoglycerate dehydrogenase [Desulfurella amilsii]
MFKVFATRNIPKEGLELLKPRCEIEVNESGRSLTKQELLEKIKDKDACITQLTDKVDKNFFEAGQNLKIVANYAVGFDNIDLNEATKRSIFVTNTPDVLTQATAELAWALLFACSRKIVEADKFTRAGLYKGWDLYLFLGLDISNKTLGIIGAGRIGQAFAKMSKGFKINILYTANSKKSDFEEQTGAKFVDLNTLLKESDFVSIHAPLTPHTYHLIGKNELSLMKKTAVLINTSRGAVIDEQALIESLENKQIYAAGLDVYEREPIIEKGLKELDNVILLPHIGSATYKTRIDMSILAVQNILDYLDGRIPRTLVNKDILKS